MGNEETHPLPRGGTDLTGTERCSKGQALKLHQYALLRSLCQAAACHPLSKSCLIPSTSYQKRAKAEPYRYVLRQSRALLRVTQYC